MSKWCVYLIYSDKTKQSYVGSTVDYNRRLRQHNRLLKGGASSTRRGAPDWRLCAVLEGFESRSEACRWEAIIKRRGRTADRRFGMFWEVADGICPRSNKKQKHYDPPKGLSLQTW